jgi:hypothetical protein
MKLYKTRYPELEYAKLDTGLWMLFAVDELDGTRSNVGRHYHSKIELLADLNRYATEYGL